MSNDFELPSKSSKAAKPLPSKKPEPTVSSLKPETADRVDEPKKQESTPKYDPGELLRIFDEIIFAGEYVEEVVIRGRLPVRFSTRTAEQVGEIQDALDAAGLTLISSIEQRRQIMSLEQALVSFNGTDLSSRTKEERSKFIAKLAAPVIMMLLTAMGEFELKIAAACREESNF